jgi:hypothetical protein
MKKQRKNNLSVKPGKIHQTQTLALCSLLLVYPSLSAAKLMHKYTNSAINIKDSQSKTVTGHSTPCPLTQNS